MTLEALLKEACAKGMTHLTVYPVPSQDNKTLYWCARATPSTGHSYVQTQTLDPVEAVMEVLKALPKAPKRTKAVDSKPSKEPDLVTAPVNHPEPQPGDMSAWLPKT